jgi:GDPmannose 4,6-dehydratase
MFGKTECATQNENTPLNPNSPYACAKAMAFYLTRYYREAFGLFASNAILYNHESPRRTPEYVTRKVTQSVARIVCGKQKNLALGDLSACIDWGYAKEFMEAAWQILQLDQPDDFVIATGEGHSVKEWVEEAFAVVNLQADDYLITDPSFLRPTKTSTLIGNITKARNRFGFNPKYKFKELVRLMVEADLNVEQ